MVDTRIQKWIWTKLFSENENKQQFVWTDIAQKIWLTWADQKEFQDTGSYSKPAQALIDKYKTGGRVPLVKVPTSTTLSTWTTVDNTTMWMSNQNATYWKDPAVDNIIASQYINSKDKAMQTYTDKIWMETGIYADIQNIDTKVLETYKILWMSDQDIFSRQDISAEEKVAMSNQRKNLATNRITNLRKIQQAKQDEIKTLAEYEKKKAEEQQQAYKDWLAYLKEINDAKKFDLDIQKYNLDVDKANSEWQFKAEAADLAREKYNLDRSKAISETPGIYYNDFQISQNAWAKSPNSRDTWYNWGTPGIDFAMPVWTDVVSTISGKVIKVWNNWDYGNQVVIQDEYWNQHMYSHLSESLAQVWETINSWQVIAKSGNTGFSTWPHLDYRVKNTSWTWSNPNDFLKKTDKKQENFNFSTWYDYLNSTIPNLTKVIPPENAKKVILNDMKDLSLVTINTKDWSLDFSEIDKLRMWGKISWDLASAYKWIAQAYKLWQPLSEEEIINNLTTRFDDAKTIENQKDILIQLALAWKLQWPSFESSWYNDWEWYDFLQEKFDDVDWIIKAAIDKADQLKKQYNLK